MTEVQKAEEYVEYLRREAAAISKVEEAQKTLLFRADTGLGTLEEAALAYRRAKHALYAVQAKRQFYRL